MPRSIGSFGPVAPDVPMLKTLEIDLTHNSAQPYGGLPTEMFPFDAYPWLWLSDTDENETEDASVGRLISQIPEPFNGTTQIKTSPAEVGSQRIINRESQYYVRRFEQEDPANGLPELVFIGPDNAMHFRTIRTPSSFQEKALGNMDSYEILSVNTSTREIRVRGSVYDRTEPSDDGVYQVGKYIGVDRMLRDTLDSDTGPALNLSWQFKRYAFGHAKLSANNERVTYDRLTDDNGVDPQQSTNATTAHTIRLRSDPSQWPPVGSRIQLFRHLPFCSGMVTTTKTFSQKYWMCEYETELAESFWQFFAIFGWNHYIELIHAGYQFQEVDKSGEIDHVENVAGDRRWRFHNAHAPQGGQLNIAETQNRTPVMEHPEWDSNYSQQHQLTEALGPDYKGRVTFRQYWWPPGNAAGKPGNSLEWYLKDTDGQFKQIGGCLAPDFWANGVIDAKQLFFNAAAYGDFARGLNYVYGGGETSAPKVDDFVSKIHKFEVYQFANETAGGSGIPSSRGDYPNGYGPTPGDVSGNSGSGRVNIDGTPGVGSGGGGGGGTTPNPGTGTNPTTIAVNLGRTRAYIELNSAITNGQSFEARLVPPEGVDIESLGPFSWSAGAGLAIIGDNTSHTCTYTPTGTVADGDAERLIDQVILRTGLDIT